MASVGSNVGGAIDAELYIIAKSKGVVYKSLRPGITLTTIKE